MNGIDQHFKKINIFQSTSNILTHLEISAEALFYLKGKEKLLSYVTFTLWMKPCEAIH